MELNAQPHIHIYIYIYTVGARPQDIPTRYPDPGIFEKHKDANRDRKIQDIQGSDPKSLLFERYHMILICFIVIEALKL